MKALARQSEAKLLEGENKRNLEEGSTPRKQEVHPEKKRRVEHVEVREKEKTKVPEPAKPPSWKRTGSKEQRENKEGTSPFVPDRVKAALREATTFDHFRKARPFKYLHVFSGERYVLAEALEKKCKEARLEFEALSLDRKKDPELDLSTEHAYRELGKSIDDGDWDGFHGRFPCATFSMARWNKTGVGPPPVRSSEFIYGLPGNNKFQHSTKGGR